MPHISQGAGPFGGRYGLDRVWGEIMGLPANRGLQEKPLRLVTEILERESLPYELIGGGAVQVHTEEPRSTLAAEEPKRRPSKHELDVAGVPALLEEPGLQIARIEGARPRS